MSISDPDLDTIRRMVRDAVHSPEFHRATFGGATRGETPCEWVRVVLRPIVIRGSGQIQFSYFDRKKDISKNYSIEAVGEPLDELLAVGFSAIHLEAGSESVDIRVTKKGKVLIGRARTSPAGDGQTRDHNRVKDLPLPEGRADRVLEVMGVMTADGRVRPTMRAKYTQINEFLKHLLHLVDDAGLRSSDRPLEILDCGCGSSYLTLAAHYFLNDRLGTPARIIGVDVNEEVIRKSTERADALGTTGLSFACGRIGRFDATPDIVLALHACDTATDDAIAQAVTTGAKLLLSVPCCHHDLNKQMRATGDAGVLAPVLRHGILRERTADLVTDAFRALALRIMGYRTDVVEFVSPEHTARNVMLRAVGGASVGDQGFVQEYRAMCSFWGLTPYIERALGDSFRRLVFDPERDQRRSAEHPG